jgi:hypothetical protein
VKETLSAAEFVTQDGAMKSSRMTFTADDEGAFFSRQEELVAAFGDWLGGGESVSSAAGGFGLLLDWKWGYGDRRAGRSRCSSRPRRFEPAIRTSGANQRSAGPSATGAGRIRTADVIIAPGTPGHLWSKVDGSPGRTRPDSYASTTA